MSRVTCHMSHVTCHVSHVTFFLDKVMKLIGEGSVIKGGLPRLVNRPGVAGAVLHTASSLIHSLINSVTP